MDIRTAAQEIRDTVDMDSVLALYGYRARNGFMCCPFHGEKAASLKVYPKTGGWHCFGCGRGGSVIDFVMEQEGCDFRTAVSAIDRALRLGLTDPDGSALKASKNRRVQEWLNQFVEKVNACLDELMLAVEKEQKTALAMVKILEEKRDTDPRSLRADEWGEILKWEEDDKYNEYRKEKIREMKEEVAQWRRTARRTG